MWLLKLHFVISVLCMITFIGFSKVCKEVIIKNEWLEEKKKKKFSAYLAFFVPLMNVFMIAALFMMIGMKKEDFDKMQTGGE